MKAEDTNTEPISPFDMARIRANEPLIETASEALVQIAVTKPAKNVFFRVRPETEYRANVTVVEYTEEGVIGSELYFVVPDPELTAVAKAKADNAAKAITLFTCMTRAGIVFLMPCTRPTGGHGDSWHVSALRVANLAETTWVKRTTQGGAYQAVEAVVDIPEPNWPKYTMQEILEKAFGDRVIDSSDHPVLKKMAGEL